MRDGLKRAIDDVTTAWTPALALLGGVFVVLEGAVSPRLSLSMPVAVLACIAALVLYDANERGRFPRSVRSPEPVHLAPFVIAVAVLLVVGFSVAPVTAAVLLTAVAVGQAVGVTLYRAFVDVLGLLGQSRPESRA